MAVGCLIHPWKSQQLCSWAIAFVMDVYSFETSAFCKEIIQMRQPNVSWDMNNLSFSPRRASSVFKIRKKHISTAGLHFMPVQYLTLTISDNNFLNTFPNASLPYTNPTVTGYGFASTSLSSSQCALFQFSS